MSERKEKVAVISLNHGSGAYVLSRDDLVNFIDEIKAAIDCDQIDSEWTVSLREMTKEEVGALPEFGGW